MDEILVNFILPTSNNVEVEAPEDMIVEDALDEMEEAEVIEASDWEWSVMFKESGQWIDISKTFAENGVTDGAALCLLHMGGAPRKQRRKEETNALRYEGAENKEDTEMNEILVNFVLQNDTNVEVKIPEDMIVEDALEQLVENELIQALGANMEWFVAFKESGQVVDISKTMAENGVTDGTALRVAQNGKAGA